MLTCTVFTVTGSDKEISKLIIQPEVTDGDEEIEISLTPEQALLIRSLEILSNSRE